MAAFGLAQVRKMQSPYELVLTYRLFALSNLLKKAGVPTPFQPIGIPTGLLPPDELFIVAARANVRANLTEDEQFVTVSVLHELVRTLSIEHRCSSAGLE